LSFQNVLKLLNAPENGKRAAILAPIPSYPFYSAITSEVGMGEVSLYTGKEG